MNFFEKIKKWLNRNKKYALMGGTAFLTLGSGIAYVIYKKDKISFEDWVNITPTEELEEAYEKLRLEVYCKTGDRPPEMERISSELGKRFFKEDCEKHPEHYKSNLPHHQHGWYLPEDDD